MFERFTETARRVIFFARYEGSNFGCPYIETEHLLLGLLREDKQLANRVLGSYAAVDSVRKRIDACVEHREKISTSMDMPLSHECKRALAYAAEEAERLNCSWIGTEHLLLGLLRQEDSTAVRVLVEFGISLSSIRDEMRISIPPPAHVEPLSVPGFTLTAISPKLQKGDPSNNTGFHPCHAEASPGRQVICTNMTMAEFAESLPRMAPGYLRRNTVLDATGLEGAWDFTLKFSPAGTMRGAMGGGYVSLFDAIEQQLGLKLQPIDSPPPTAIPQSPPFWLAEPLFRATCLARQAGLSEIGTDTLLSALEAQPVSGLGDIGALLSAFAIGLSAEAAAIIIVLSQSGNMTPAALRQTLLTARNKRPEAE